MPLEFGKSDLYHKKLTDTAEKRMKKLYENAYNKISKEIKKLDEGINTKSTSYQKGYLLDLQKKMKAAYDDVALDTFSQVQYNIKDVSEAVVNDNVKILNQYGLNIKGAFSYVPKDVVTSITNGSLYKSKWTLSSRIWDINNATNRDIRKIIAQGIAMQTPTYDIAKDLEKYVNPSAKKNYDWSRLYPGSNKKVDYNAQRLVRTTITHAYQQSVKEITEQNPLSDGILWLATGSKRMCDICAKRNGKVYAPNKLPLDHPNGQCTMATHFSKTPKQISKEMQDELSPKRDELRAKLEALKKNAQEKDSGFVDKVFNEDQQEYLTPYGFTPDNVPSDFNDWSHKVSTSQAGKILEDMGTSWGDPHPYQQLEKFYNKKLAPNRMITGEKLINQAEKSAAKQSIQNEEDLHKFIKEKWMGKIKDQTESHMLKLEDQVFDKLSKKEIEGLETYTGSAYKEINSYLRLIEGGKTKSQAKSISQIPDYYIKALNNAKGGLDKVELAEDLVLRRGTDLGDLAGLLSGDFDSNKKMLYKLKYAFNDNELFAKELNERYEGLQGKLAGFTSTSSLYNKGFSGDVEVILYAPKGTKASSIMRISKYGTGEGETLLNAGTNVEFIKAEKSDGHKGSEVRIFLRILNI